MNIPNQATRKVLLKKSTSPNFTPGLRPPKASSPSIPSSSPALLTDAEKSKLASPKSSNPSTPTQTEMFPVGSTDAAREIHKTTIEKIVKESSPANAQAAKPKRGRPSKADLAARGVSPHATAGGTGPGAGPVTHGLTGSPTAPGSAVSTPAPGIPPEALGPLIQFPFELAEAHTGFPGWKLSDEEAKAVVPLCDEVARSYLGALSPAAAKHAPLVILVVTLGAMTGMRYLAFTKWHRKMQIEASHRENAKTPEHHPVSTAATTPLIPGLGGKA